MYTIEQQTHIDMLYDIIKGYAVPTAVVDYLGKQQQVFGHHELRFAEVTEETPVSERFDTRSMSDVGIYELKVVRKNRAAERREG